MPCFLNTCKNGGTCVIPGNYCKCQKNFAWHDCSVNVGKCTFGIIFDAVLLNIITGMYFTKVEVKGNILPQ